VRKNKKVKIGFSEMRTKIKIKSNSSEEEFDFIDRTCPVQDTMTNSPTMKTEFVVEK
jgi:uncharacterized OsmC-like protein